MDISEILINVAFKPNPNDFSQTQCAIHNYANVRSDDLNEQILIGPAFINMQQSERGYTLDLASSFEYPLAFLVDVSMKTSSTPKRVRIQFPESVKQQIEEQRASSPNTAAMHFIMYANEFSFDGLSPIVINSTDTKIEMLWDGRQTSTPYMKHRIVTKLNTSQVVTFSVDFFEISDINMDGKTDATDAANCLSYWGGPGGDVNGDGNTDAQDISMIMNSWSNNE